MPSIAVPGDPALVSPVAIVNAQQASNGVFIVPIVLGVILLALIAVLPEEPPEAPDDARRLGSPPPSESARQVELRAG